MTNFTYYSDWAGFNIPSSVLFPFKQGKFKNLTKDEKNFLHLFEKMTGNFYIIGSYGKNDRSVEVFNHELAHAFYFLNKKYKEKVDRFLKQNIGSLRKFEDTLLTMGYCKEVVLDELNAYLSTGYDVYINDGALEKLANVLKQMFEEEKVKTLK
jgi:hypothetical protein